MNTEIKIKAQPQLNPELCDFLLENPVAEFGAFRFTSPEEAKGSALAEEIFSVGGVSSLMVIGSTITVKKNADSPWTVLGKEIGQAIRRAFKSGTALISETAKKRSPEEVTLVKKVMDIILSEVNPSIASHGGYIDLIDVHGNDIFIKMGGGCQGCASSQATLKQGVEQTFRKSIPELGQIIDTTDHAAGKNPYFS